MILLKEATDISKRVYMVCNEFKYVLHPHEC